MPESQKSTTNCLRSRVPQWSRTALVLLTWTVALVTSCSNSALAANPGSWIATPGSAFQEATPATERSFEWSRVDLTLDLDTNGEVHVSERMEVTFRGGPFRRGFRRIPLSDGESIANIRVSEERDGKRIAFSELTGSFDPAVPQTYLVQIDEVTTPPQSQIDWSFSPASDATRTFVLEYDFGGAVKLIPPGAPRFQEITWIVVDSELLAAGPVREATITVNLPPNIDVSAASGIARHATPAPVVSPNGQTWTWSTSDLSPGESFVVRLRIPLAASETPDATAVSGALRMQALPNVQPASPSDRR